MQLRMQSLRNSFTETININLSVLPAFYYNFDCIIWSRRFNATQFQGQGTTRKLINIFGLHEYWNLDHRPKESMCSWSIL